MHKSSIMVRIGRSSAVAIGVLTTTAVAAVGLSAPAQAAIVPAPVISYTAVSNGSAIESGLSVFNQANGVAVGSAVRASVGTINYVPSTAVGYKLRWFSCPTAGAAINTCQSVASATGNGSANGKSVEYTPVAGDLGRFLVAEFEIISQLLGNATTNEVTSDRGADIKVVPGLATSPRPAWSTGTTGWVPGGKAALVISPWTLPSALRQTMRGVNVWACDSANAGQVPESGFSTAGCTAIPAASVLTNVNVAGSSVAQVQTTADMAGKYLLAQVNLTTAAGNTPSLFVIRSLATQLGTAASALPSPSASPSPSSSADAAGGSSAGTDAAAAAGSGDAAAVGPMVTIVAKRAVARGRSLGVAVQLTGTGQGATGSGVAIVQLVKDPQAASVSATLKKIAVKKGKGFRLELIPRTLKRGAYYLRVIYTDAGSGAQAAAVKRVTLG